MDTRVSPSAEARPTGGRMHKVQVVAELSEEFFRAYEAEAKRQGVRIEQLVEQTVNTLLKDLEREEEDHPITMS